MSEYAEFVDYTKIKSFKEAMVAMGRRTVNFLERWGVKVNPNTGAFHFPESFGSHGFKNVTEGLGNKNWIAGWMEKYSGMNQTFLDGIGIDTMLMAINDVIAFGAMPVVYTDEVASGRSEWFYDRTRVQGLTESYYRCCEENGVALVQGESPALKFLINTVDHEGRPVDFHCPSFSGTITGVMKYPMRGLNRVQEGDTILAAQSSEWHCNGASLIIKHAMGLPDKFMTKLLNGKTLGEQALTPTLSYVNLVEALLKNDVDVHGLQPITGGGLSKLTAASERDLTYFLHDWDDIEVPPVCQLMREIGVPFDECLQTFNWGMGFAVFVPAEEVEKAYSTSVRVHSALHDVGVVREGPRRVIFHPADDLVLLPPGD